MKKIDIKNKDAIGCIAFNDSKVQQLPLLKAADVVYGWHNKSVHKVDGWLDITVVDKTTALVETTDGVKVLNAEQIDECDAEYVYFHAEHYSLLSCAHHLKDELKKVVFINGILVVL